VRHSAVTVFTSHWLAMTGLGLVLVSILLWGILATVQLRQAQENPYIGIGIVAVGALLLLGLLLTPIGLYRGRRRLRERLAAAIPDRKIAWRRFLLFLVIVSGVSLLIVSQMTLRVVHGMESRQFCGSCHVMAPQAHAFPDGPHAGLLCVDCHVGDGAHGFVQSKLQGARQLFKVLTGRVEQPIASPIAVGRMVPTEQTCESCHRAEHTAKATLKLILRYAEDEANTPVTTLLTMNVGGAGIGGIHGAHHGAGVEIDFVATDPERQRIPLVEYRDRKSGVARVYVQKGVDPATLKDAPRITMQCIDCHNRAAHTFQLPDEAIDRAIMHGRISASLPFLKKTGLDILRKEYPSSAAAAAEIPAALVAYYEKEHPEAAAARAAEVREAASVLAALYARNVFPEHRVAWGTYPDNGSHERFPGCFRCHDDQHETESGEVITKKCFACHFPAAVGETRPEILELLGVDRLLRRMQKK
jgi:nitrate/TMAO reductase-like tetraheme cytochrome c subunit